MSQSVPTVTIDLEAMTYGGDALGRLDGKAIFVEGGIAGERVQAEIVEDRSRFARARVVDIVAPSPDRVRPRCPHFGFEEGACGGCHWQHIDYAAQLRFKADIVREQLRRIGRIENAPVLETIPSPDVWAYRNHAQFSVAPDGRLGFQATRSHRVVPIDECHVVQPPIMEWLQATVQNRDWPVSTRRSQNLPPDKKPAEASTPRRQVEQSHRIEVRCGNAGDDFEVWEHNLQPPISNFQPPISNFQLPISTFHIKDATFRVSAASFFQVNTSLIERLVDEVMQRLDPRSDETVLDAYCGVGLFARFVAPGAGRVIGIESSASAVADAQINLAAFENVTLKEGQVERMLLEIGDAIGAAIVDPPRAGCGPAVIAALTGKRIERVVYVSCDPATLARDARQLIDGGYRLIDAQPIDLFPHTYHIEAVAHFRQIAQQHL
jgi:23S rRNA (uracil1939-C5)-methyltransferase